MRGEAERKRREGEEETQWEFRASFCAIKLYCDLGPGCHSNGLYELGRRCGGGVCVCAVDLCAPPDTPRPYYNVLFIYSCIYLLFTVQKLSPDLSEHCLSCDPPSLPPPSPPTIVTSFFILLHLLFSVTSAS